MIRNEYAGKLSSIRHTFTVSGNNIFIIKHPEQKILMYSAEYKPRFIEEYPISLNNFSFPDVNDSDIYRKLLTASTISEIVVHEDTSIVSYWTGIPREHYKPEDYRTNWSVEMFRKFSKYYVSIYFGKDKVSSDIQLPVQTSQVLCNLPDNKYLLSPNRNEVEGNGYEVFFVARILPKD